MDHGLTISNSVDMEPYPGDGVRPTNLQASDITKQGEATWSKLKAVAALEAIGLSMKETLVDLLRSIPPLALDSHKSLSIKYDKTMAWLQFAFDWITTSHPECEQNVKRVRQVLLLGVHAPILMNFQNTFAVDSCSFDLEEQLEQMIFLISAWSYIMSSRWVELLQSVGEKAAIQSSKATNDIEFRRMIFKRQWRAILIHDQNEYFAPWSLTAHDMSAWFVFQISRPRSNANSVGRHEMCLRTLETRFVVWSKFV